MGGRAAKWRETGKKVCPSCKSEKPLKEFYWLKSKEAPSSKCILCEREYGKAATKLWRERNPQKAKDSDDRSVRKFLDLIDRYRTRCKKCGESRKYLLQFHHRDPSEKLFEILHIKRWSQGRKATVEEILKCEILCANCHIEFHHLERQENITLKTYLDGVK